MPFSKSQNISHINLENCYFLDDIQWWPIEMRRQKHFLLFITNPWHYENKQGTIKKPYKNATRTAKNFFIFFKKCWFWGPILKNLCLRKMGVAGIKWWPCLSTIPSFLININEEAFLKVSFKNIDWFQIWKNYFF